MSMTPLPPDPRRGPMLGMESAARHRMDVSLDGKAPQDQAKYQPMSPDPTRRCEVCQNFQPPSSCGQVAGPIDPRGTCMLFTPEDESPGEQTGEPGEEAQPIR